MTIAHSGLEAAAIAWWEGKRPMSWTDLQHAARPCVNCAGNREKALAEECARRVDEIDLGGVR